jgi:hypothetical protein
MCKSTEAAVGALLCRLTHRSRSFITLSSVLEGVGTSAYLGGAPLITSKAYLTVAGSILVTEALHTSLQRLAINEVPMANPYGTVRNLPMSSLSSTDVYCSHSTLCLCTRLLPCSSCPAPRTVLLFHSPHTLPCRSTERLAPAKNLSVEAQATS